MFVNVALVKRNISIWSTGCRLHSTDIDIDIDTDNNWQHRASGTNYTIRLTDLHTIWATSLDFSMVSIWSHRADATFQPEFIMVFLYGDRFVYCMKKQMWKKIWADPIRSDDKNKNYISIYLSLVLVFLWLFFSFEIIEWSRQSLQCGMLRCLIGNYSMFAHFVWISFSVFQILILTWISLNLRPTERFGICASAMDVCSVCSVPNLNLTLTKCYEAIAHSYINVFNCVLAVYGRYDWLSKVCCF